MSDFTDSFFRLTVKINNLIISYNDTKTELSQTKKELEDAKLKLTELEQNNKNLEDKYKILTLAKSIPDKGDKAIVKKRINELLRELDICIEQINNNKIQ